MKFVKSYSLPLFVFFCSVFTLSCELDKDPNEGKIIVNEVTADIDTATTWNRATIYIIKKENFKVNSSLTIQAGATIKFDPQKGRSIDVTANGHISAQATIANPIIFTSLYDDSHGHDSNYDKNATMPHVNDWNYIHLGGITASVFTFCEFYYSGGGEMPHTIAFKDKNTAIAAGKNKIIKIRFY